MDEKYIVSSMFPEYNSWYDLLNNINLKENSKNIINKDYKEINQILINTKKIPIEKIKLCGSFGKETIIEQKKEIDIIVYIKNFNIKKIGSYINDIKKIMIENNISKEININKHSINFEMVSGTKVDILPCGKLPNNDVLLFISDNDKHVNSSVSNLQKKIIKNQNINYKNVVKIFKFWRYNEEWPNNCYPISYMLEIIIMYIYKKEKNKDNISSIIINVLKFLINPLEINIIFEIYYDILNIPDDVILKRPLILDITNPTNNIADNINFNILSQKAKNTLQKIYLNDLTINRINETYNMLKKDVEILENKANNIYISTIDIPLLINSTNNYENYSFVYSDIEWKINFYWNSNNHVSIYLFATKYLRNYDVTHCSTKYIFEMKDKNDIIHQSLLNYTLKIGGSGYGSSSFIENKKLGLIKSNDYKNFIIPVNVKIKFVELNFKYSISATIKKDYTNETLFYKNNETINVRKRRYHNEEIIKVGNWNIKINWSENKNFLSIFISPIIKLYNNKIKGNFRISIIDNNYNTHVKNMIHEYDSNTSYGWKEFSENINFPDDKDYELTFEYELEHYLYND